MPRIRLPRAFGILGALALAAAGCAGTAPVPVSGAPQVTPTITSPVPAASVAAPSASPSAPAAAPALALEACGEVTHFQDGSVGPVLCPDGRPSRTADVFLRSMEPALAVLRVGTGASLNDVETAMCADKTFAHTSNLLEESAYRLMAAEAGWGFGDGPIAWLVGQAC